MNNDKRVIIYCRESRDDNGVYTERIETQRDLLIKFCQRTGYTNIIDIIMHDDWSGADFKRFDEIRQRAINKEFDIIVMKDSSRLGRNLLESLKFIEFLEEYNIEVVFEGKSYDADFFPLEAWFNERRAKDDSKKIRTNLKHKMEEGKLLIREHFGYRKDNGKLIIDEDASKIVRKIFDLYLKGYGYRAIANTLQKENIPTPSQYMEHGNYPITKAWRSLHVQRILMNQIYVGDMVSGKTEKVSFKTKKTRKLPKDRWIIVKDNHEAIIAREDYNRVQEIISSKTSFAPKTPNPSPFSSITKCGRCGSSMYIIRSKRIPHAFMCGKYYDQGRENGGIGCTAHRTKEEDLFVMFKTHLEYMENDVSYRESIEKQFANAETSIYNYEASIEKSKKEMNRLQEQYKELYNDKLNKIIPEFIYVEKSKELEQKINNLQSKITVTENEMSNLNSMLQQRDRIGSINKQLEEKGITRELVQFFVNKIVVFDKGEITQEQAKDLLISDKEFEQVYNDGGIILDLKHMYQHVLTNRWIREHIGTWRERTGMR